MKPFNLQEALAGKPVVTRNGNKVTNIVHFPVSGRYTVAATVDLKTNGSALHTFTNDGKYSVSDNCEFGHDLFMASTKKTGWVNVYRGDLNYAGELSLKINNVIHPSKAMADKQQETAKERIAVVELTWEE